MINRSATSNAFEFVAVAALRAQQLQRGCIQRVPGSHKHTTMAQMEIVAGKVARIPATIAVLGQDRGYDNAALRVWILVAGIALVFASGWTSAQMLLSLRVRLRYRPEISISGSTPPAVSSCLPARPTVANSLVSRVESGTRFLLLSTKPIQAAYGSFAIDQATGALTPINDVRRWQYDRSSVDRPHRSLAAVAN